MSKHNLGTLTANGSTTGVRMYHTRDGGDDKFTVFAVGTFDGATVTYETSPDSGTTWISAGSDGIFTTDGQGKLEIQSDYEEPMLIRATVSSAGGSTDVTMYLFDKR